MKLFKGNSRRASPPDHDFDSSDEEETFDEYAYGLQSNEDFNTMRRQRRNLTPASISPYHGSLVFHIFSFLLLKKRAFDKI